MNKFLIAAGTIGLLLLATPVFAQSDGTEDDFKPRSTGQQDTFVPPAATQTVPQAASRPAVGPTTPPPLPTEQTRSFPVQNVAATELRRQIVGMLRSQAPRIIEGESIIVTGESKVLELVAECVKLLDVKKRAPGEKISARPAPLPAMVPVPDQRYTQRTPPIPPDHFAGNAPGPSSPVRPPRSIGSAEDDDGFGFTNSGRKIIKPRPVQVSPLQQVSGTADEDLESLQREAESLRKVHAFLEEQVAVAVRKVEASRAIKPLNGQPQGDALKELKRAVTDVFHTRQSLQRNELREYAYRLQGLRNAVDEREKRAEELITARVNELAEFPPKGSGSVVLDDEGFAGPANPKTPAPALDRPEVPNDEEEFGRPLLKSVTSPLPSPSRTLAPVKPPSEINAKDVEKVTPRPVVSPSATTTTLPGAPPAAAKPATPSIKDPSASVLQGIWRENAPLSPAPSHLKADLRPMFVFQGNRAALIHGDRRVASYEFTVDTSRQPHRIWLNLCEGEQSLRGIFEIKDRTLRLQKAGVDDAFPTKFSSDRPDFVFGSSELWPALSKLMEQIPPLKKLSELPVAPAKPVDNTTK